MEEQKYKVYPIYCATVTWQYIDEEGNEKPNSIYNIWMSKHPLSEDELNDITSKLATNYFDKKTKSNSIGVNKYFNVEISHKYLYDESWCCRWFSHYTFDDGHDNDYYIKSFKDYIDRRQAINRELESKYGTSDCISKPGYICLMGAEDEWRWGSLDDSGNAQDSYPCRCKGCKDAGIISINH